MTSRLRRFSIPSTLIVPVLVAGLCLVPRTANAQEQTAQQPAAQGPKAFATPQEAADELIKAASAYDVPQLLAIFGPDGKDIVSTADPVQDKNNADAFAEKARVTHTVKLDPSKPNRATLVVGQEQWPLPVPLVKKNAKWYFDARSGRQEILFRRIGTNELDAIQVCRGFVEAQKEYASQVHDDSGINQYAQKIFSSPGKQDGLYWQNADGSAGGPIGEAVAKALAEGYSMGKGGYHGYYFKILKGQGPTAPMGRLNYVIEGVMIGGFALVAVPAEYRVTGVKTFIVNNDGIVYQKDLGPNSLDIVKSMELYNPDSSWRRTDDEWPQDIASASP
ncbi:DUF2950 domain-containing protein [Edaphobacter aggregans]|uniref:DUF2950 domain-containing protein n=1 Tax=Edaphobacter aggregans TaxID=570835 RepID=UPI0005585684|nr:DUF2950 domain-containing protein [Edaphobacter aggregans]